MEVHTMISITQKRVLLALFGLLMMVFGLSIGQSAELKFTPEAPSVKVGQEISLSVSGTSGDVKWVAVNGLIQGSGKQVTYLAPNQIGVDGVVVLDAVGNVDVLTITVQPVYSPENANWEIYTNRDFIYKLAYEANTDNLWVATGGGLEVHEAATGKLLEIYTQKDGIPSTQINALEFDQSGNLWVGTPNGLAKRAPTGQWESITTKNSNLPNDIIWSLHVDDRNTLWIGTIAGLASYSSTESSYTFKTDHPDLPIQPVRRIVSHKRGFIYVALWDGSLFFRNYEESSWRQLSSFQDNGAIEEILVEPSTGHIWLAYWIEDSENPNGYREVIDRFNSETETWDRSYDHEFTTTSLFSDSKGNLWVGTEGGGLATLIPQEEKWNVVSFGNTGVSVDYITTIQEDKHGNMWIGTGSSGRGWQAYGLIQRKADGSWLEIGQSDLPSNEVYEIIDDGKGGIWVGTLRDAVRRTKEGEWELFDPDPEYFNSIEDLYQDNQGGLWVTSFGQGLFYRSSEGEITRINKENSNIPSDFIALYVDKRENLWVTTPDAGFAKMREDGSFEIFNTTNSELHSNYNTRLEDDGQGGFWVGTGEWTDVDSALNPIYDDAGHIITHEGKGLIHLNAQGKWGEVINTSNSQLPDNNITALRSDNNGGVWIGTPQGLAHYKADGQWEIFKTDNPELPGNRVSALLTDESGGLWVGMNTWSETDEKGKPRFDAAGQPVISSHGGLAYRDAGGEWILFDSHNSGLPDNVSITNSLHFDGEGGLWIGTVGSGLIHLTFGNLDKIIQETGNLRLRSQRRAAIIIAGGGNNSGNTLWETTESISNYLYQVLNKRGFLNEEIYYLSPKSWADFNGDGYNDSVVDAPNPERPLTVEDIQEALVWATKRGKLDQPLYLFFIDHGGIDKFQLSQFTYMDTIEFKSILDDYQNATDNEMVIVIDACHSGSLLEQLVAPNRAIISSTGAGLAYFDRLRKQGFSRFLANGLLKGMNFYEAFEYARDEQHNMIGDVPQLLTGSSSTGEDISQIPQFEDGEEGQWLRQVFVNGSFAAGDLTLAIEGLTTSTTLPAGETLPLKAKVFLADGRVTHVWAVLKPPKLNFVMDSNGTPILAFPRFTLFSTENEDIWETTWRDAVYNGDYEITFYAEDNQGNIASSDYVIINVTGGIEPPSQANVQILLDQDQYHLDDHFKVELIENLGWGYDLYVAIVLPDGQFRTLKNTNEFAPLNQPQKWLAPRFQNNPLTLMDSGLPDNWTTGEYCLYGILSPEREDVFETLAQGLSVVERRCVNILGSD